MGTPHPGLTSTDPRRGDAPRRSGPAGDDQDLATAAVTATPRPGAEPIPARHLAEPPFRVLLVCTANRCRTPIVEHLMRRSTVLTGAGWAVVSAGVKSHGDMPMHPLAAEVLAEHGVDTSGWLTRALTPALVSAADLVLAADRRTRRDVVTLVPESLNRTFVLGQFARLAALLPPVPMGPPRQRGLALIGAIQQTRSLASGVHDDDLADPIGHRIRRFRATARTVGEEIVRIEQPYRT